MIFFFSWKLPIHLNLHSSSEKKKWGVFSFFFFFLLKQWENEKKLLFTKAVQYDRLKGS